MITNRKKSKSVVRRNTRPQGTTPGKNRGGKRPDKAENEPQKVNWGKGQKSLFPRSNRKIGGRSTGESNARDRRRRPKKRRLINRRRSFHMRRRSLQRTPPEYTHHFVATGEMCPNGRAPYSEQHGKGNFTHISITSRIKNNSSDHNRLLGQKTLDSTTPSCTSAHQVTIKSKGMASNADNTGKISRSEKRSRLNLSANSTLELESSFYIPPLKKSSTSVMKPQAKAATAQVYHESLRDKRAELTSLRRNLHFTPQREDELLADDPINKRIIAAQILTPEQEDSLIEGFDDDDLMLGDSNNLNVPPNTEILNSFTGAAASVTVFAKGRITNQDLFPSLNHSFKNCESPDLKTKTTTRPETEITKPLTEGKARIKQTKKIPNAFFFLALRQQRKRKMGESNSVAQALSQVIIRSKKFPLEPLTDATIEVLKTISNEFATARAEYEEKKKTPTENRCSYFGSRVAYGRLVINCGSKASASYMVAALNAMGIKKSNLKQEVVVKEDCDEGNVHCFRFFSPVASFDWSAMKVFCKSRVNPFDDEKLFCQSTQAQVNRATGVTSGVAFSVVAIENSLADLCDSKKGHEIKIFAGTATQPFIIKHVSGGSLKGKLTKLRSDNLNKPFCFKMKIPTLSNSSGLPSLQGQGTTTSRLAWTSSSNRIPSPEAQTRNAATTELNRLTNTNLFFHPELDTSPELNLFKFNSLKSDHAQFCSLLHNVAIFCPKPQRRTPTNYILLTFSIINKFFEPEKFLLCLKLQPLTHRQKHSIIEGNFTTFTLLCSSRTKEDIKPVLPNFANGYWRLAKPSQTSSFASHTNVHIQSRRHSVILPKVISPNHPTTTKANLSLRQMPEICSISSVTSHKVCSISATPSFVESHHKNNNNKNIFFSRLS